MKSEQEIKEKLKSMNEDQKRLNNPGISKEMRSAKFGHSPYWVEALKWVLDDD